MSSHLWVCSLSCLPSLPLGSQLITAPVSAYQNSQGLWKTSQASLTKRIERNLKIMAFSSPEISFSNRKNMISGFQLFWKSHLFHTGCQWDLVRHEKREWWDEKANLPNCRDGESACFSLSSFSAMTGCDGIKSWVFQSLSIISTWEVDSATPH